MFAGQHLKHTRQVASSSEHSRYQFRLATVLLSSLRWLSCRVNDSRTANLSRPAQTLFLVLRSAQTVRILRNSMDHSMPGAGSSDDKERDCTSRTWLPSSQQSAQQSVLSCTPACVFAHSRGARLSNMLLCADKSCTSLHSARD